jgi:hypothetical protein
MSGRLSRLEMIAPHTRPICTAIAGQAELQGDRSHISGRSGSTAEAKKQVDIDMTRVVAARVRASRRPRLV